MLDDSHFIVHVLDTIGHEFVDLVSRRAGNSWYSVGTTDNAIGRGCKSIEGIAEEQWADLVLFGEMLACGARNHRAPLCEACGDQSGSGSIIMSLLEAHIKVCCNKLFLVI